ncbi:MAG: phosphatidylglycerophosphatase A, partial [Rhodospirillaceae bacterium]
MSLYSVLATWFGVGKLRYAPGSMGSLSALPLAWWLSNSYGSQILISVSVILFIIGVWASEAYASNIGQPDPGSVVIDEVAGQLFNLGFVTHVDWSFAGGC